MSQDRSLRRIVLASANPGKLREFATLFETLGVEVVPQQVFAVPSAAEPHPTFIENALAKARQAAKYTSLPALADDSGLCVRALDGAPGVHSARYAQRAGLEKSDAANNAYLVSQLRGSTQRHAYYYCVLAFIRHADDPEPVLAEGRWHGEILDAPRGIHGFGYDPYFYVPALQATAAELDPTVKNTLSHRAHALHALSTRLSEEL